MASSTTYRLHDHGDGAVGPDYGLRLDNVFGGGHIATFSFDDNGAAMFLTAFDDNDDGVGDRIRIFGSAAHNQDGDTLYTVDFLYVTNVSGNPTAGWTVGNSGSNVGSISAGPDAFEIGDDNGDSFLFLPDGHRLAGDDSTWVGRGWLTLDPNSPSTAGTQDWLFTGELVPLPGAALMAGVGLVGVAGIRRRRDI